MSEPTLDPVTLCRDQTEMVEQIIHNLKAFRSTGHLRFFADACHAIKELGDGLIPDAEEAALSS